MFSMKDSLNQLESKKYEILGVLESKKYEILQELSGTDKCTVTRLREIVETFDRIEHNIILKIKNIEEIQNAFIKSSQSDLLDSAKAIEDLKTEIEKISNTGGSNDSTNNNPIDLSQIESQINDLIERVYGTGTSLTSRVNAMDNSLAEVILSAETHRNNSQQNFTNIEQRLSNIEAQLTELNAGIERAFETIGNVKTELETDIARVEQTVNELHS